MKFSEKPGFWFKSITVKLSFWFSLTILALLAFTLYTIYFKMKHNTISAAREYMQTQLAEMRDGLSKPLLTYTEAKEQVDWNTKDIDPSKLFLYYVQVLNTKGQTTARNNIPWPYNNKLLENLKLKPGEYKRITLADETFAVASIYTDNPQYHKIILVISVEDQQRIFRNINVIIITMLIASLILSITFTSLGVRHSISSLKQLVQATKKVDFTNFKLEVNLTELPHEVRQVALGFNQTLSSMESAFVTLTQFSNDLAHEMRTPLQILLTKIEAALKYGKDNKQLHDILKAAENELQHMNMMVTNMLFLAKLDNTKFKLKKVTTDMNTLLQSLIDTVAPIAKNKSLDYIVDGDLELDIDPNLFRQALLNLIDNAIKYSPEGGLIEIELKKTENTNIIAIHDQGIGISSEEIKHLTQRFFRAKSAVNLGLEGHGLGLCLVREIIKLHHGHLEIDSEINKGTTVTLTFPKTRK